MPADHCSPPHAAETLQHLRAVGEHNAGALRGAARLVLGCLHGDGLVFTAGAGHSLAGVLESFYRAGGLAGVRPLQHPDLLPLNGAMSSSRAERRSGLAEEVLVRSGFRGGRDVLVVFSNSGVNPYPVELALNARRSGSPVIALTSPAATAAAPKRASSTLVEQATVLLDTHVPPGDASHPPAAPVTAPLSSLANVFLWNLLLVEIHERATAEGTELPTWRSANTADGDAANRRTLARYGERIPELR